MTFEKDFVLSESTQQFLQAKKAAPDIRFLVIHMYIHFWLVTKVVQVFRVETLTQSPEWYSLCKNAMNKQCPRSGTKFIFQALFPSSQYSLFHPSPFENSEKALQFVDILTVAHDHAYLNGSLLEYSPNNAMNCG